jgi:hypothetical protein
LSRPGGMKLADTLHDVCGLICGGLLGFSRESPSPAPQAVSAFMLAANILQNINSLIVQFRFGRFGRTACRIFDELYFTSITAERIRDQWRANMKIRVQRKIEVYPKLQNSFLNILFNTAEQFHSYTNIYPDIFIRLFGTSLYPEVRIFMDFDSLAQYEDIFLHKILKDTKYLDSSGFLSDMIIDEPQDEMYARVYIDDFFMNLKHKKQDNIQYDVSGVDGLSKHKKRFRIEREYCASKSKLADVLKMNFDFTEGYNNGSGHIVDYFCTRFSAERIGSAKIFWDSDDCLQYVDAFLQQDQEIASNFEGLLKAPPRTTVYRRLDSALLRFDAGAASV